MESFNGPKLAGFAVSFLGHALLVTIVTYPREPLQVRESPQADSREQFVATVIFLQDPAAVDVDGYAFEPTFDTQAITVPIPQLPEMSAVAADSFEEARQIESAEDFARVERLQGIYTKQIADRIRRVLQMTATQTDTAGSPCIVRVIQNESGDVIDVDMQDCERPPMAREQLARAIRSASPLPCPPEGLAMGSYLTIDATAL